MGIVAKYVESSDFLAEARSQFRFLLDVDFLGPEEREFWLSYSGGMLGVDVVYEERDGRIVTVIRSSVGDRNPRAGLDCLYVSAKLGPAQDIRGIARSPKFLRPVLESQAAALRKVMPVVASADGNDLLLTCHGR